MKKKELGYSTAVIHFLDIWCPLISGKRVFIDSSKSGEKNQKLFFEVTHNHLLWSPVEAQNLTNDLYLTLM